MVVPAMQDFDYHAPAELYASPKPGMRKTAIKYRRFNTSAAAIQYVMEELPPLARNSAVLEVDETRFDPVQIVELYESSKYPLKRRAI
jgi:hypothetical protein